MKRSMFQPNFFTKTSSSPTSPIASAIWSEGSNPTSFLPTSEIPQQQSSTKKVSFLSKDSVVQALSRSHENLQEIHLSQVCIDDDLIWLLIESNLERLYLRNCTFDSNNSFGFNAILKFLGHGSSLGICFKFAVQFNNCLTHWILSNESSNSKSNEYEPITSLLFIVSSEVPQQLSLNCISSLVLLPSKSGSSKSLSFQSKRNLKSIIDHLCPNLKHLLLKNMNLDGKLEDFVSISRLKLDLVCLWNCGGFTTSDPIWSVLYVSMNLINSMHEGKIHGYQFTTRVNEHTTQAVISRGPSFFMPNSSDLVCGLILPLGQDFPSDLSIDNLSLLALLPSRIGSMESLFPQSEHNSRSIVASRCPNLKYILLTDIDLCCKIEDFISISQQKLDLIYLSDCKFEMTDSIWSVLHCTINLISLMQGKSIKNASLRFRRMDMLHILSIL